MSRHTLGGMSDLTIPEYDTPPRWTTCVVCGGVTSQPPVCHDLRCENAHYNRTVTHGFDYVVDRYAYCTCGRRFGPGPYKMRALKAHAREEN